MANLTGHLEVTAKAPNHRHGGLDNGFGTNGIVLERIGDLRALIIQPDGKLVGAGFSDFKPFTLARFNEDGSLDATFGDNGVVHPSFPWLDCYPRGGETNALAIDRDDNLIAVGSLEASFAIARFRTTASTACGGDCDGNDDVVVNEMMTLVNIALGDAPPSACPHGLPSDTEVVIAVIVEAVNHALNGCGGG
jgi:hypothetical protein